MTNLYTMSMHIMHPNIFSTKSVSSLHKSIFIHSHNVFTNHSGLILQKKIRKFAQNKQTNRQTNKQTENSNTETTLIPCGSSGRAGQYLKNSSSLLHIPPSYICFCLTVGGLSHLQRIFCNKFTKNLKISSSQLQYLDLI